MAELDPAALFAQSPVAMLATVGPDGAPHVVPVVFAVNTDREPPVVYTAVDAKRKSTKRLQRLTNIEANPRVSMRNTTDNVGRQRADCKQASGNVLAILVT